MLMFRNGFSARAVFAVLLFVILLSCSDGPVEPREAEIAAPQWESYGQGVDLEQRTEIAAILGSPDEYVDQDVAVEGTVVGVCAMMGCWIELERDAQRMRIKVDDGVIVFPAESQGRHAIAQGKVERLSFSREEYISWAKHQADEKGETFDPEVIGDPPYEVIRIWGTGALIEKTE